MDSSSRFMHMASSPRFMSILISMNPNKKKNHPRLKLYLIPRSNKKKVTKIESEQNEKRKITEKKRRGKERKWEGTLTVISSDISKKTFIRLKPKY